MAKERNLIPHCDDGVLHKQGECEYCDDFPQLQWLRDELKINFTGHHDPKRLTCPAELRRSMRSINSWGGNRPLIEEGKQAERILSGKEVLRD